MTAPLLGPRAGESRLILASASAARAAMLRQAGLTVEQCSAAIDEDQIKRSLKAKRADPESAAMALAEAKAVAVSGRELDAFVIGADQLLICGQTWFGKPADRGAAWRQLSALRGRTHRLISAVCVMRGRERLWGQTEHADLSMRPFSDEFIDRYLDAAGDAALQSVGGYQLEGLGAQLFSAIDGDYFVILGLPLLALLDFLRGHGIVAA